MKAYVLLTLFVSISFISCNDLKIQDSPEIADLSTKMYLVTSNNFGDTKKYLTNSEGVDNSITNVSTAVKEGKVNGAFIDLQNVPSSQKNSLSGYVILLNHELSESDMNSEVYLRLPLIDSLKSFDFDVLIPVVDKFILSDQEIVPGLDNIVFIDLSKDDASNKEFAAAKQYYLNNKIPSSKLVILPANN